MSQNIGIPIENPGGNQTSPGLSAAGSIATNPFKLRRLVIQATGTAGSWLIVDGSFQGAFSLTTQYQPGQIVTNAGTTYYCILASLGNAVTNTTYFVTTPPATSVLWTAAIAVAIQGNVYQPDLVTSNGIYLWTVPTGGVINVGFG
jgi:hypothetical protein